MATVRKLSKSVDPENSTLTLVFGDENSTQMVCALNEYSDETIALLALHGLSQKLGDTVSGMKGDFVKTIAAVTKVNDSLIAGLWKIAREAGTGRARSTLLARAVARIKGVEVTTAKDYLDSLEEDDVAAMRKHTVVAAVIAEIKSEDAKAKVAESDTDIETLLGGLN